MPDVSEAETINAELVEDLTVMPATVTPTAPSYALTRHTLLGPGEPPASHRGGVPVHGDRLQGPRGREAARERARRPQHPRQPEIQPARFNRG